MPSHWRQGDVLFEKVEALPNDLVARNGDVLFVGERSGHAHRVSDLAAAELLEGPAGLYMRITAPTSVVHDEHRPILFEPGLYRVWRQREYRSGQQYNVQD